ncbi:MAG: FAD-dependent oxidoreductase, partial [Methanobacteriota archaeon]
AAGLSGALPGQYLLVRLDAPEDPRRGSRSFTMANAPSEPYVLITTRMRAASAFKRALAALRPGDRVPAKGPFGRFGLRDDGAPALMVAAGVGVTPFRAMVRHAIATGRTAPVTVVTSDRVPGAVPFRTEFDTWATRHPWLRVVRTITRPSESSAPWTGRTGRIDAGWLVDLVDAPRVAAYVAGSPAFVEAIVPVVQRLGVPADRITLERFLGY